MRSADFGGQHDVTFESSVNPAGGMSHALILCDSIAGRVPIGSLPVVERAGQREEARMLTDEHHAVNTMIDQGAAFDQIEDYINTLALPGEQLSALWLLAWAEAADPATRRQVVEVTLGSIHQQAP